MKAITFEQLPEAVTLLLNKIENLEKLLHRTTNTSTYKEPEADEILTVQKAAEFLGLAVPTIYSMVNRAEIPASKAGKRLYFSKDELKAWIKEGRRKTVKEIESEAESYMQGKGK